MNSIRIIFCCLLSFLFIIGCGGSQDKINQEQESGPASEELTLPQIPKIPGPYKPTNKDIQAALQKSGFYHGEIDGDIGPLSKEAIRKFQAANKLVVDGKVGPKTWAALGKYLSEEPVKNQ